MAEHKVRHLDSIESLRGVAALMVLLYHLAELVKIPLPESMGFISARFGLGVPLFYTLSGFVLAYGYADKLFGRAQIYRFYIRRWFRIAPLFYTMLLLWLIADWIVWNKMFSFSTLFLNVSFLFGLIPGQHESIVWAGWSIGIEMLFYLMFPIFAVLIPSLRSALIGFVVACILSTSIYNAFSAAGLGSYAYMNLVTHLPFFMAGISCFRLWQCMMFAHSPVLGWLLLGISMILAITVASSSKVDTALLQIGFDRSIWAIVFGLLLLSACYARNSVLESFPLRHLGQLSFSIYLLHPMVMITLIKLEFSAHIVALTGGGMIGFLCAALIVISLVWGLSTLSFRFVEKPGIEFGQNLLRRNMP